MKLREFVANSLPRVRGRKKKNQSQKTSVAKERTDSGQAKCPPSEQRSHSVIYQEPNNICGHKKVTDGNLQSITKPRNRHTISEIGSDASPQYDSCNEYQTSYLNTSLDDTKYVSSKDFNGFLTEQEKNSLLIYASDCERQYYGTGQKSRSRIRTNPWLPSPLSTPYNDQRAFPCASLSKTLSSGIDESIERCYSDKDVSMETDVSPTTPGSTDSGFKSSVCSDINIKPSTLYIDTCYETKPTRRSEKVGRSKKKNSKVLKVSESFDNTPKSVLRHQAKLCERSQTTVDIDSFSSCRDNSSLDKTKWQNHYDLSLVSPPLNSATSVDWSLENCRSTIVEKESQIIPYVEHNISFEYEETLNCCLGDMSPRIDNANNVNIFQLDITKEVAVQTDFEDNEESDWMTASSFDEATGVNNQTPRKLSLISDCMQESTDTGYSSLTRDGLIELDEDFQFVSNKENINDSLNGWLGNKEQFVFPSNMGQSWCEGGNLYDSGTPLNPMCQSWYGGSISDQFEIPFNMTTSMYIPAEEVKALKDHLKETTQSQTNTADPKRSLKPQSSSKNYTPVLEYGPVIHKPHIEPKLDKVDGGKSKSSRKVLRSKPGFISKESASSPNSPDSETRQILNEILQQEIDNVVPIAASTPMDEQKPDPFRQKARLDITGIIKSPLSSLNSRSSSRQKSKKTEIRKPRDNLDVIRDYLGYASFEDFYFAKKCPPLSTGRTLNQIKTSLEEKVDQLRQETFIVEQKISEAQEEERIKHTEKLKFQKHLQHHRKQMLLQTLHDLKDKLENQSERLQKSYSTILNLQSRFSQRHSPMALLRSGPM